ncbi:MAG: class I SAM-dependent methyltransferase [Leeuwenhoekiella sp.]
MSDFNPSYTGLRTDLLKFIKGEDLKVLDVGCASGVNGKYLLDQNMANVVYGIEYDEIMAQEAAKWNTKTFIGDLNLRIFREEILRSTNNFDFIIFGDILEHLYSPVEVLTELKNCMADEGKIIISLPNIAHIELFIQVFIKGRWPRNNRGIFDRTHLRWFTKKDAEAMIKDAGLKVIHYKPTLRARDAIGSSFDWKTKLIRWVNKDWVTFQHIFVCEHDH